MLPSGRSMRSIKTGRIQYANANDEMALEAFKMLSSEEGILPALETSHGLAYAFLKEQVSSQKDQMICVNLSGRGDKDAMEACQTNGC